MGSYSSSSQGTKNDKSEIIRSLKFHIVEIRLKEGTTRFEPEVKFKGILRRVLFNQQKIKRTNPMELHNYRVFLSLACPFAWAMM